MGAILPCWRCGVVPEVDPNGGYPIVACRDCYDGAPDSPRRHDLGSGMTVAEAIGNWNEKVNEEDRWYDEMEDGQPHPSLDGWVKASGTLSGWRESPGTKAVPR